MPLYLFYTMMQKVKNDQNSNQGGGGPILKVSKYID